MTHFCTNNTFLYKIPKFNANYWSIFHTNSNADTDIEVALALAKVKKRRIDNWNRETNENEIEAAKERQIFDPINRIFDFSKRRAANCPENTEVFFPQRVGPKIEGQIELLRNMLIDEYK